ncbi:MAG: hypothetical protein ACYCV4_05395 [Dermatophilaceae bacterium]
MTTAPIPTNPAEPLTFEERQALATLFIDGPCPLAEFTGMVGRDMTEQLLGRRLVTLLNFYSGPPSVVLTSAGELLLKAK